MSAIKSIVGDARFEAIRAALVQTFPDPHTVVSDEMVDTAIRLAKSKGITVAPFDDPQIPALDVLPSPTTVSDTEYGYYVAHATHERFQAPYSKFTGHVPMVRLPLPLTGIAGQVPDLITPGGSILAADRLFPSVEVMGAHLRSDPRMGYVPERVDLITPPRIQGARFAAIALYLGYKQRSDRAPSFYVLEAGLATGQPRMRYLGPTMDAVIAEQTRYQPTSFSARWHWYRGTLEMRTDDPNEPYKVGVQSFLSTPPQDQYIGVTVRYQRQSAPDTTWPYFLLIQAGARLSAIADALGADVSLDVRFLLRFIAGNLSWERPPQ